MYSQFPVSSFYRYGFCSHSVYINPLQKGCSWEKISNNRSKPSNGMQFTDLTLVSCLHKHWSDLVIQSCNNEFSVSSFLRFGIAVHSDTENTSRLLDIVNSFRMAVSPTQNHCTAISALPWHRTAFCRSRIRVSKSTTHLTALSQGFCSVCHNSGLPT